MDEAAKLALRAKVIDEQTKQFWDFCKFSQKEFNVDCERVVPDSVQEFAVVFFDGLEKVLRAI